MLQERDGGASVWLAEERVSADGIRSFIRRLSVHLGILGGNVCVLHGFLRNLRMCCA